ncbi:MAG: NAD(+) diphosphatase [Alkalispirochaeta sp.]
MLLAIFPDSRSVLLLRKVTPDQRSHTPLYTIPTVEHLKDAGLNVPDPPWQFAHRQGESVSGVFMEGSVLEHVLAVTGAKTGLSTQAGLEIVGRREAADLLDVDDYWHMNRAFHLADWDRRTRFCGSCASPMERSSREIAKSCPSCGATSYPQIAPAVIMAVVKDGRLLMANSRRHTGAVYSVLAGFVEAGETLEHAVSREVHEEAGILIRNIEYFSSQPWPFPNSLMIAFTAEWSSGEITAHDDEEIVDIGWFTPGEIPSQIPSSYSVARRLIEWFVSEFGTADDLQRILDIATG